MDLENIEVFLEIARTRSISGAAKKSLYIPIRGELPPENARG
ncbi:MAG: hypothetical protein ACLTW9_26230 [Enterocloster sp.]